MHSLSVYINERAHLLLKRCGEKYRCQIFESEFNTLFPMFSFLYLISFHHCYSNKFGFPKDILLQ